MYQILEELKRKDIDLITMLDSLKTNDDTMGIHELSEGKIETRVVLITPEVSERLLERNIANRKVSGGNINVLASEMEKGKWMFNGEAVVFDYDGKLRNGQHRLNAIIKSGEAQQMLIITGVLPESFATMDIGSKRTGGDILSIKDVENPSSVSALCKFIYSFKNGVFTKDPNADRSLSNTEIYDYYKTLTNVSDSIEFGTRLNKDNNVIFKPLNKGQLSCFHYLFSEKNNKQATEFLEGIFYGNNLDVDSPILAMRNRLLRSKQNKNYKIGNKDFITLMVVSWNKWRNNEKAKNIKIPKDFKLELI